MESKPSKRVAGSAESKADHFLGYTEKIKTEFQPRFRALMGKAYQQAALAGCDVRPIANFLESLKESFRESGDTLAARGALDTLIATNNDPALEPILQDLREEALQLQKDFWLAELQTALAHSESEAWTLFVNRFAEALCYWRTKFCIWWTAAASGKLEHAGQAMFSKKYEEDLFAFQENSLVMEQARWQEALPFISSVLANNALIMPKTRAFMAVISGSIYLYHIDASKAKPWFDKAEAIAPTLPYLSMMRAELERWNWNLDSALSLLETHLSNYPNDPDAYVSMGQCYQYGKNDLNKSIECYDLAIQADPGNTSGYQYKMAAWGSDQALYSQHRAELEQLAWRLIAIEPEGQISTLISASDACQRAGDFQSAEKWLLLAQEKESSRFDVLISLGTLYKANAANATPANPAWIQQSAAYFEQAIGIAPKNSEGYTNMALLRAEVEGKKAEAATWYEKAIPYCPLFEKNLLVEASKMYLAAENFPAAAEKGLQALRLDPSFDYAMNALHDVADKLCDQCYKETGEKHSPGLAIALYKAIREIKGENYEANFQNRVGNVYYYFADYQNAANHYQNAISSSNNVAVYYDNLAGALDNLNRMEEAWKMAEMALNLDAGNNVYRKQATALGRKVKSLRHFGVSQDQRSAVVEPIRIRFMDNMLPYFVAEGSLLPIVQEKITAFRKRFETVHGLPIPGIKFADDHVPVNKTDNFSIELDGFKVSVDFMVPGRHFATGLKEEDKNNLAGKYLQDPAVPGILWFEEADMAVVIEKAEKHGDYLDFILLILESVLFNRADRSDLLQYDYGILSERFVGESSDFASKFFQFNRMLIKFKISIFQEKETIFEVFKGCYDQGLTLQQTFNQLLDEHPPFRENLPINRALLEGKAEVFATEDWQEKEILANIVQTKKGTKIWEVANVAPESAFSQLLAKSPDAATRFIKTTNPDVATVLNDIVPGCAFLSTWTILQSSAPESSESTNQAMAKT